jgi:hypothetical protein
MNRFLALLLLTVLAHKEVINDDVEVVPPTEEPSDELLSAADKAHDTDFIELPTPPKVEEYTGPKDFAYCKQIV